MPVVDGPRHLRFTEARTATAPRAAGERDGSCVAINTSLSGARDVVIVLAAAAGRARASALDPPKLET